MTNDRGGRATPNFKLRFTDSSEPPRHRTSRFTPLVIDDLASSPEGLYAKRKVREIVTRSGRGVRGYFPSFKGKLLKFESLVEEDTLRTLEIAGVVKGLVTQPCVLQLHWDGVDFRYTPDILATIGKREYFVEVKAASFIKNPATVRRLRAIIAHLRKEKIPFILVTEDDIRANSLQDELKLLLRSRATPGRFDPDINSSNWDPRHLNPKDPELMRRWRSAQAICDDLIKRLMRRDPDSMLPTLPE